MGEGSDELARAAKRRRDREAAKVDAEPSPAKLAAARAKRERWVKANRTREALAEAGWQGRAITNGAILVGLLAPVAVAVFAFDMGSLLVDLGFAVIAMGTTFGMMELAERGLAAVRLRRLRGIGRGLDVDRYLAALGENRRHATVIVRATFGERWPDDTRAQAHDGVREWLPSLADVAWDGASTLVMRSARLDGTIWLSGGEHASGGRYFDNRALHGHFLGVVRRVLPRLEAIARIDRLAVEVDGDVEAFDADA